MNAESPREISIEYAQSRADLDKFMAFVWESGNGQPLSFDVYYAKPGWQVIMVCKDRGLVHSPAHARRFAREMRAAIARKAAQKTAEEKQAEGTAGAFAICDAWDSRAKLALQRNRDNIRPN